jgi:hypothetical protein
LGATRIGGLLQQTEELMADIKEAQDTGGGGGGGDGEDGEDGDGEGRRRTTVTLWKNLVLQEEMGKDHNTATQNKPVCFTFCCC